MHPDDSAALDGLSERLKALRMARYLRLQDVAEEIGVSASVLSRIESGHRQLSTSALLGLARCYQLSIDEVIGAPPMADPRTHLRAFEKAGRGVIVPLTRYPGKLQVFKQVLGPRPVRFVTHPGHGWICVLSGSLRVLVEDTDRVLTHGEVFEIDATRPHWFGPEGDQVVELLHLFGPGGDRPQKPPLDQP